MPDLIWIHHARPRTAWYELPEEEQTDLRAAWDRVRQESVDTGGLRLGEFNVRGQSDYSTVELWLFPSPDDAFDHWSRLTSAYYAEWFVSANTVGMRNEVSS